MRNGFHPSEGATISTFQFGSLHCQACGHDLVEGVNRMVGIDTVDFDLDTLTLSVSYFPPTSDVAIRQRLADMHFPIAEALDLTIVAGEEIQVAKSA